MRSHGNVPPTHAAVETPYLSLLVGNAQPLRCQGNAPPTACLRVRAGASASWPRLYPRPSASWAGLRGARFLPAPSLLSRAPPSPGLPGADPAAEVRAPRAPAAATQREAACPTPATGRRWRLPATGAAWPRARCCSAPRGGRMVPVRAQAGGVLGPPRAVAEGGRREAGPVVGLGSQLGTRGCPTPGDPICRPPPPPPSGNRTWAWSLEQTLGGASRKK